MADHIVVFDGTERLIGRTVRVAVTDASPFTLYGDVLTAEIVGAPASRERERPEAPTPIAEPPVAHAPGSPKDRFSLPLI